MILLDTHVLLWWALDPVRLSATAAGRLAEMEASHGYASSISIWELAIKVRRGALELPITVDELARRIERGGIITLLPVDTTIWLRSASLPWDHRDPADRVIVATALGRGVPILTKDSVMHAFVPGKCLW